MTGDETRPPAAARPWSVRTLLAVLLAVTAVGAACTDDDAEGAQEDDAADACNTEAALTDEYVGGDELGTGYGDEPGPLGSENPDIPAEFPEQVSTTPFPAVAADQVIAMESFGVGQGAFHLVDPEEGSLGYVNVATGADVWAPAGGESDLLAVVGAEAYRPRGARGELVAVVTFFDANGAVAGEVCLPRNQYGSVGGSIPQLTADGRHVVLYDRRLPGYVLVDVAEQRIVDEVEVDATCMPGVHLADADTGYVLCWRSGEIVELSIGDGSIEVADSAEVFAPETPVLDGTVVFAPGTGLLTAYTRFSEVLAIDLSEGLPDEPVEPVDVGVDGHIVRSDRAYLTPDGTRAVVGYVEGDDYTAGDPAVWRVLDTATWREAGRLEMPHGGPAAVLPTADSTGIFVLANEVEVPVEGGEPGETEEVSMLSVLDLASGREVASTRLDYTTDGEEFTKLYRPVPVGGQ